MSEAHTQPSYLHDAINSSVVSAQERVGARLSGSKRNTNPADSSLTLRKGWEGSSPCDYYDIALRFWQVRLPGCGGTQPAVLITVVLVGCFHDWTMGRGSRLGSARPGILEARALATQGLTRGFLAYVVRVPAKLPPASRPARSRDVSQSTQESLDLRELDAQRLSGTIFLLPLGWPYCIMEAGFGGHL